MNNNKMSNEAQNPANCQLPVSGSLSFEEMIWNKRFPDEDFDADNFYDWAAENGKEAFYLCIDVARDLGL
jgi:hypothetical protein